MLIRFVFLFLLLSNRLVAQQQFSPEQLLEPKKYGPQISALLGTQEIPAFKDTAVNTLFLRNGFRSSTFVNEDDWLAIQDSVEVYRIDVVYSKYPLRKGVYEEIYPLLCSRLVHLFALDEELNSTAIVWNKVLQTACHNDEEADQLLHGVVIWYRPRTQVEEPSEVEITLIDEERTARASQSSLKELNVSLDYIAGSSFFSDSLKAQLEGKTIDQQRTIIRETLEKELATKPDQDLSKIDKIQRNLYLDELNKVVNLYRSDSTVYKILSRHPEWQDVAVVNDWTGSMYGYGTQVVEWHIRNREISGIKEVTLFNDGDMKSSFDKKIGETGGIYTEKADNVEKLIGLFQLVMMKGSGGDGPENDIEAILEAIEEHEEIKEVILIADNYPCVRDISLANRIGVPVRVIVCGYTKEYGINPDLVYLAKITNGGVYTIEDDLENPNVTFNDQGGLISSEERRFRIAKKSCESNELSKVAQLEAIKSIKQTRFKRKKDITKLDLSNAELTTLHKRLYKLTALQHLDLNTNKLVHVSPEMGKLTRLGYLNIAHNQLTELPVTFNQLKYLQELYLSDNQLATLPKNFLNLPFLLKLDLSQNSLSDLGKISNLRRLKECDLSYNKLTSLPRSFQSMKYLRVLALSNNRIAEFPTALTNLRYLEEIDLSNNQLTKLPATMNGMRALKILHLEGNNFPVEEQEQIRKELGEVMVYF
ncbi:MAG: leucine-rich repeat domain-containing protein [Flavobacteriia bacterium]|nr:leucine-rich repeat domain-containing protein [Flavobacteriia bacterium]